MQTDFTVMDNLLELGIQPGCSRWGWIKGLLFKNVRNTIHDLKTTTNKLKLEEQKMCKIEMELHYYA